MGDSITFGRERVEAQRPAPGRASATGALANLESRVSELERWRRESQVALSAGHLAAVHHLMNRALGTLLAAIAMTMLVGGLADAEAGTVDPIPHLRIIHG